MIFEWNPSKAASNLRKHGISFLEAATVFRDPLARTFEDPDHSLVERREITIGCDVSGRLLVVAHVERQGRIRIISARCATRRERIENEEE